MLQRILFFPVLVIFTLPFAALSAEDFRTGIPWKKPVVVTPPVKPGDPPGDAIILFDGKDMSAWNKEWTIENGELVCVPGKGDILTNRKFGSVQFHLEFSTPVEDATAGKRDQGRGNSGVFFGPYEVQILDSYESDTYHDGQCASIYKQIPPLVNVCRPPGEWQTYDIVFNRPDLKVEEGVVYVLRPGYITVFHNGVLVVDRHQLKGSTFWHRPSIYESHEPTLPIRLQDHGNKIRFRNIWVREIPDINLIPEPNRVPYIQRGNDEVPVVK